MHNGLASSASGADCKFVEDFGWVWGEREVTGPARALTGEVVCLTDAYFNGLTSNGRLGGLLRELNLTTVEVSDIQDLLSTFHNNHYTIDESVHTVIISVGSHDIKANPNTQGSNATYDRELQSVQVRDGVLQSAELIARKNFEDIQAGRKEMPLSIILYSLPEFCPADEETEQDVAVRTEWNDLIFHLNTLLKSTFEDPAFSSKYPHLASLRVMKMFRINAAHHKPDKNLYHTQLKLNSRGQSILVQRILDDVIPMWPGGNPPNGVMDAVKQLGMKCVNNVEVEQLRLEREARDRALAEEQHQQQARRYREQGGKGGRVPPTAQRGPGGGGYKGNRDSKQEYRDSKSWASIAQGAVKNAPSSSKNAVTSEPFTAITKMRSGGIRPAQNSYRATSMA
eukprot:TRINITY_DN340_c0_g1_i2.p2 TRINITY_DN340_c0_g1~~TRINITY_DN340_c0_g1_i2.p2  ORF type:complete len:397 (+),score=149.81 TRINITY_DN340_c0_g1_i2:40-1230(+)